MAPTVTTKAKTKTTSATQLKSKKPADDKKAQTTKPAPAETPKRKKGEDEPSGKAKKARVTFAEPVKITKGEKAKPKAKAKETEQPKEKKSSKPKVLAPPAASESESDNDEEDEQPKKPQPKTSSSKQPPQLISANANAKSKSKQSSQPQLTPSSTKKSIPKKAKPPSLAPSESAEEHGSEKDVEEVDDEEAASSDDHLHGFSTDDEDSSDEDAGEDQESEEKPGLSAFEISKLPTVAKDDESVKRKLEKAKRQPTEDRGVVYIGRLPHGFYEVQLRSYFSQFGDITRLRVSRNKKTGKCKHYGFIEFASSSVAQIVAETMDNYLLTGHILKCKLIPKNEIHPELWIGANRKWRVVPRDRIVRVQHNKSRTEGERVKVNRRLLKRQNERKRKLEALGIEYDFDAVGYKKAKTDTKA